MKANFFSFPFWFNSLMQDLDFVLWGVADLSEFATPMDNTGKRLQRAISWAVPMTPGIMAGIKQGPNKAYADEYVKVNNLINSQAKKLTREIKLRGFSCLPLAASERTDLINIKGDFPHKTAATRAGLGWIGRNCQLITRDFGSWVRLGTVFTDMDLPCGPPVEHNLCGRCTLCVDACPAGALNGKEWYPGIPREDILDVKSCDSWKKEHYFQYNNGLNCGICSAVCPFGLKLLKKS
ncbi:MAG: 4Fe-4S double cluster binding domain-containing protein [Thermodesulfobacteriota bacterium]|nr:4Fe-4S double cluster binding domain-containing protein [Thermodesulfobacteriota bacterium]